MRIDGKLLEEAINKSAMDELAVPIEEAKAQAKATFETDGFQDYIQCAIEEILTTGKLRPSLGTLFHFGLQAGLTYAKLERERENVGSIGTTPVSN